MTLSVSDTVKAISDDKALVLCNTVALAAWNTKKQYYSRISELTNAGLVIKQRGKYFLTSLGKLVYEAHMLIGKAIETYWKLKAIDSIELSSTN